MFMFVARKDDGRVGLSDVIYLSGKLSEISGKYAKACRVNPVLLTVPDKFMVYFDQKGKHEDLKDYKIV